MRGPGTKPQQGQDKARGRKTPVPAQTERRGRVSEDSLGWREEGMARHARLGWREGAKAREAGPGNTGSEREASGQLGLGRATPGQADKHKTGAWREGGKVTGCGPGPGPGPGPGRGEGQGQGQAGPGGLQCRTHIAGRLG